MATTTVQRTLNAAIEPLFEHLSDHLGYARIPSVKLVAFTRKGNTESNGLGAQRHIKLGRTEVWEDIVGFERPTLMEYRIVRMKPNILDHKLGRITLTAQGANTDVVWTSKFHVAVPLLGRLLEKRIGGFLQARCNTMLNHVERRAQNCSPWSLPAR